MNTPANQHSGTVEPITPTTAAEWIASGDSVLVDVREPDEQARDRIEGALSMPLSRFDPVSLPADRRLIFHCRSGRRSLDAAERALRAGRSRAYSLTGGIQAWKAAGLRAVENRKAPISLMRQVQITIGVTLLLGAALALWVDPWFLVLPAFIGAGQLFAGLSGTCGLAALLGIAPWNRALRTPA